MKIKLFILFTFIFIKLSAQENVIDQIVAIVGNNIILKSDIENQYTQLKAQGYSAYNVDLKCEIFEELLYQKLLLNQAQIDSVEITENQVEAELERRLRYFINQIGSEEKLEEFYNKSILEIKEEFKDVIHEQLLTQMMQSKITDDIKITPSDVRNFFKNIPKDSLPVINSEIELEQIVKYPNISETEKLAVTEKLQKLQERITQGENFATLAVMYSEDPGSAKNSGELGFVGRADLVPEFAAVAFKLKENDVSRIVKTEFGYHIIQLIEKKGELSNFRHILLTPKISPYEIVQTKNFLDSVATLIRTNKISFEKAALKFSEDENTKNNGGLMVNPLSGNTKFEPNQIEPLTSYAIKNLKIGEISEPFETKDEKQKQVYKIVHLKTKTKPHKANLNDDYQKIQDTALAEKKQNIISDWINKKQLSTYINIDESYKNCDFNYKGWMK